MTLKFKKPIPKETTVATQIEKGQVLSEETKQADVPAAEHMSASQGSADPWCEVGVEMSYTHNLGDYRSVRCQVTLKVPCLAPEIDEAFVDASKWVEARMDELVAEMTSA